jgi:uncharacterized protein involved in outer membrane biogenesis
MLRKRWFRWAVILAAVLLVASEGFSLLLRTSASRRYLTARLESSFGRPVEVRTFAFSLLDGPRIEAFDVSVAEDPRFGQEYFLRAAQLTAGPRWSALLTGHFEFGTLSFTQPTLNLVRLSDGHWNLESWLPAAATPGDRAAAGVPRAALRFHLSRIEIDTGRINFKQDQDVRPFALEDVSGYLDQDSGGAWQLDFQAQPMRPGVAQPQSGMMRVSGVVGGTSSRLQPADVDVSLWGASIEDALRLARGGDYGIRGELSADLHASIEHVSTDTAAANAGASTAAVPATWNLTGVVRLSDIHRWDFPSKPGQPTVNVILNALWRSGEPRVALTSLAVEAPESAVRASGELVWNHGFHPHFDLAPSAIAYNDLLAWYRALRTGVDDNLSVDGWVRAEGALEDWPPRLIDASLASAGARIVPRATLPPLRLSRWNTSFAPGVLNSSLVVAQFEPMPGAPAAASAARPSPLQLQASLLIPQDGRLGPRANSKFRVSLDGTADRVQDYLALAREFGSSIKPAWTADGSLTFHVHGQGDFRRGSTDWQGSIETRGLLLQFAFLNQPLYLPGAVLTLGSGAAQKLTLTAAHGFDTNWSGTISRSAAHPAWQFDLTADRLDAAALDRWLEPLARPAGLLERLGLAGAQQSQSASDIDAGSSPPQIAVPISASGRLRVGDLVLAPLHATQLDADVEVAGKSIEVHRAKGTFAGGTIAGDFTAALGAAPAYDAHLKFGRIDLATLAQDVPSLQDKLGGIVGGLVTLQASGIGRDALFGSLEGQGSLAARNLDVSGFNLGMIHADRSAIDDERFAQALATFRVDGGAIHVALAHLMTPGEILLASGTVDFAGALDFRIASAGALPPSARTATAARAASSDPVATSPSSFHLTGTIAAPSLAPYQSSVAASTPTPARNALRGPQH